MAEDEKVYSPDLSEEAPFPSEDGATNYDTSSGSKGETFNPEKTPQRSFPTRIVARETIGSSLNTKSRKIMAEFTFTEMGAISVGKYEEGVSGDIRITPAGFVARNTSGNITVAIDGETGNAIFAGELQAGTLITGDIIVGNNTWIISGDPDFPRIVLYNNGIPEIVIGEV